MTNTDTRRDNVEYHQGRDARRAGIKADANPYSPTPGDPDCRRARWALGHAEGGEQPRRRTLAELEQLAADCMESSSAATVDRHKRAADEARAAARCEHDNARGFYRTAEARELLAAVELEAPELTTAERLIAAAVIAARANGDELEAPTSAELLEAGDELASILESALETHIYEPDEIPEDADELVALEAWERAKARPSSPIRVLVAIEGGLVQSAVADRPGVSVITLDYDTEGTDPDEVFAIPQDGGGTATATRGGLSAEFDPAWIDAAEAAELADPEAAIARLRRRAKTYEERYPDNAAECRREADEIERRLKAAEELEAAEPYAYEETLARYDAGAITDEQAIAELQRNGWAERRAYTILEEHQAA